MYVELEGKERELMIGLVEARIGELAPEIRRCRNSSYHDKLREELHAYQRLLQRLHESSYDVTS